MGRQPQCHQANRLPFKSCRGKFPLCQVLPHLHPWHWMWSSCCGWQKYTWNTFSCASQPKAKLLSFPLFKNYQVNCIGFMLPLAPSRVTCPETHLIHEASVGGGYGGVVARTREAQSWSIGKPEWSQPTRGLLLWFKNLIIFLRSQNLDKLPGVIVCGKRH